MPSKRSKLLIGVTGGIGSGKSLVCGYFKELGGEIFYADKIARELYSANKKLKAELVKTFENKILDENKNISFTEFRKIVFKSDANQKRVNGIVHPFTIKEILERTRKSKSKLVFIEAALIFESGFDKYLDYTVEVYATVDKRIARVRQRNNLSVSTIKSIIKLQMPEKEKVEKADFVIKNNSAKSELRKKTEFVYSLLNTI
jgi:dephospho-CoA kinase